MGHPCFDDNSRHKFGRIHLPVAPKCNVLCNYCNRKYDCAVESRPGVTSAVLTPGQAYAYLHAVMAQRADIAVVGIAGPGDPFANPEETLETLRLVRRDFPDIHLCISTNGLRLLPYIEQLAELRVSHVTVTVNAVDPSIGALIYAWVRDGVLIGRQQVGAKILLDRQLTAIRALKERGITVKINTIIIPGINDTHIDAVAKTVATLGADVMNCVPLYPVAETVFGTLPAPSPEMVRKAKSSARRYLPVMSHCTRCRADAVGLLGEARTEMGGNLLEQFAALPANPEEYRPYVAVVSQEGVLVNQHLGDARVLRIYTGAGDEVRLLEERPSPPPGGGDERWRAMAHRLSDCRALLVNHLGATPREVLSAAGLQIFETEGIIHDAVAAVLAGHQPPKMLPRKACSGCGCRKGGTGCG